MLHNIHPALCKAEMYKIIEFQKALLEFACKHPNIKKLTKIMLEEHFGQEIGGWLWGKMKVRRNSGVQADSKLFKTLWILLNYLRETPSMPDKILQAFDNDIKFETKINDPSFTFLYNTKLSNTARKKVRGLMERFYIDLLENGFPQSIHGDKSQSTVLTRSQLVSSFVKANEKLKVCPACDGQRSAEISQKLYADTDHFFPKSKYPFLSVHPYNLVPICVECNEKFKKSSDPIDNHSLGNSMIHTFQPYSKPATKEINIRIERTGIHTGGAKLVKIYDTVVSSSSRRVNSFNRLYRLESRWLDKLDENQNTVRRCIARAGTRLYKANSSYTDEQLKQLLREHLVDVMGDCETDLGKQTYQLLQKSYIQFALSDEAEFEEVFAQYMSI